MPITICIYVYMSLYISYIRKFSSVRSFFLTFMLLLPFRQLVIDLLHFLKLVIDHSHHNFTRIHLFKLEFMKFMMLLRCPKKIKEPHRSHITFPIHFLIIKLTYFLALIYSIYRTVYRTVSRTITYLEINNSRIIFV